MAGEPTGGSGTGGTRPTISDSLSRPKISFDSLNPEIQNIVKQISESASATRDVLKALKAQKTFKLDPKTEEKFETMAELAEDFMGSKELDLKRFKELSKLVSAFREEQSRIAKSAKASKAVKKAEAAAGAESIFQAKMLKQIKKGDEDRQPIAARLGQELFTSSGNSLIKGIMGGVLGPLAPALFTVGDAVEGLIDFVGDVRSWFGRGEKEKPVKPESMLESLNAIAEKLEATEDRQSLRDKFQKDTSTAMSSTLKQSQEAEQMSDGQQLDALQSIDKRIELINYALESLSDKIDDPIVRLLSAEKAILAEQYAELKELAMWQKYQNKQGEKKGGLLSSVGGMVTKLLGGLLGGFKLSKLLPKPATIAKAFMGILRLAGPAIAAYAGYKLGEWLWDNMPDEWKMALGDFIDGTVKFVSESIDSVKGWYESAVGWTTDLIEEIAKMPETLLELGKEKWAAISKWWGEAWDSLINLLPSWVRRWIPGVTEEKAVGGTTTLPAETVQTEPSRAQLSSMEDRQLQEYLQQNRVSEATKDAVRQELDSRKPKVARSAPPKVSTKEKAGPSPKEIGEAVASALKNQQRGNTALSVTNQMDPLSAISADLGLSLHNAGGLA